MLRFFHHQAAGFNLNAPNVRAEPSFVPLALKAMQNRQTERRGWSKDRHAARTQEMKALIFGSTSDSGRRASQ